MGDRQDAMHTKMISPGKILWLWLKIDEFLNFMVKVIKKTSESVGECGLQF
jgi:hypothetical protein